jgi:hypothetical protein
MKSKIAVAVTSFLFPLLWTPVAFPCTCIIKKHRTDFRQAKAVFVGRVIEIDRNRMIPERLSGGVIYSARIRIEKAWKGSRKSEVAVFTWRDFGCGGFDFQPSEKYLVYVFDNELIAYTTCSRTRHYERSSDETDKELKQLDSFWFRLFARVNPL